ncbi:fumarate reductase/succinate dehydrogenase flavoprotein domain protein [Methylobacterium sp. 4-46]|uniref:FAD-dependent oxidoreductase n=1 Tax=unclassified Methylobacterium TaxID=2615210 RepID=UPI000165CA57|nr:MULTISPECIES: FAD-dependent oxidoreductase [Methylobacterium]ACA16406.1 fumarate reductase/succinate dehydrogenase flavoprotein domain protein [Methylobacterium sp. 4-46]WFT82117.1 FAD-dependent oxidoreductase [Methylobacterium nodulans]
MTVACAEGVAFAAAVPVAVIGAGAAGLVAALAAREAGAEVLVLERDPVPRGSTALSAGLIPAPFTRWQRAAGIADSPEDFAADIMAKAGSEPDPGLVRLLTRTIGPALEWLADRHGLDLSVITDFRYPGHRVHRMHGLPSRSGEELVDRLRAAVEAADIPILCGAAVDTLFAGPGTIRGLGLVRPDGTRDTLACAALVLACNGYGGNKALVARHVPELAGALYFGHEGNRGDALLWGEALGAATRHLSGHQGHGSVAHPHGILITWATVTEGGFQVNAEGRRFADESRGYSEQAAEVLRQPGGTAVTVFDARIAGIAAQFEDFRRAQDAGAIVAADTVADLAARLHLPEDALAATLAEVEALKEAGGRDAFGRSFAGVPALVAPYRAVRVTGALFHTQGGLVVDDAARVLTAAGGAIPNLFAAGGAACGVSGTGPGGYLSGNGLLAAVALGRVAGASAGALAAG